MPKQKPEQEGEELHEDLGVCGALPPAEEAFEGEDEPETPEVVPGILREGQLAILAGRCNVGKTPLLMDLWVRMIHGIDWLTGPIPKRPVILVDYESEYPRYKKDVQLICNRFGVPVPKSPGDVECYMERWNLKRFPATARLLEVGAMSTKGKLAFLGSILERKPNALLILDPIQRLFTVDTKRSDQVVSLYGGFRHMLSDYPKAAVLSTLNLRKLDKRTTCTKLIEHPDEWMEEVSGTADIINRCDVRLGMEADEDMGEGAKVVNGFRRSDGPIGKLLIESVGDDPKHLAGYRLRQVDSLGLSRGLTEKQQIYWSMLPLSFTFDEALKLGVPRVSFHNTMLAARGLSAIKTEKVQRDRRWITRYTKLVELPRQAD